MKTRHWAWSITYLNFSPNFLDKSLAKPHFTQGLHMIFPCGQIYNAQLLMLLCFKTEPKQNKNNKKKETLYTGTKADWVQTNDASYRTPTCSKFTFYPSSWCFSTSHSFPYLLLKTPDRHPFIGSRKLKAITVFGGVSFMQMSLTE